MNVEKLIEGFLTKFKQRNKKWFFVVLVIVTALKVLTDFLVPAYFDLGEITPKVIGWITYIWAAITTVDVAASKGEEKAAEQKKLYPKS